MPKPIVLLVLFASCWPLTVEAGPRNIELLWEDQFDLAGKTDQARAVAVSHNRVIALGVGESAAGGIDLLVRAYDPGTGTLVWWDQSPLAPTALTTVVIDDLGQRVFAAGYSRDNGGADFLVRAYNARNGNRLWEDVSNKGRDDYVQDIAASRKGVFVVGQGGNIGSASLDLLVRAHDPNTGALLWEDQVDKSGTDDIAWKVVTDGQTVFVAGSTFTATGGQSLLVRAYDAASGEVVWEKLVASVIPAAMALDHNRLYIGGTELSQGPRPVLLALRSRTGRSVWQKLAANQAGNVRDLAVNGPRLFAVGSLRDSSGLDRLLASYNSRTGELIWEGEALASTGQFAGTVVEVSQGIVFVGGTSSLRQGSNVSEFFVRAYDPDNGKIVWEDKSHPSPSSSLAFEIGTKGRSLFVVGVGNNDFLIRTYAVEPAPLELPPLLSRALATLASGALDVGH